MLWLMLVTRGAKASSFSVWLHNTLKHHSLFGDSGCNPWPRTLSATALPHCAPTMIWSHLLTQPVAALKQTGWLVLTALGQWLHLIARVVASFWRPLDEYKHPPCPSSWNVKSWSANLFQKTTGKWKRSSLLQPVFMKVAGLTRSSKKIQPLQMLVKTGFGVRLLRKALSLRVVIKRRSLLKRLNLPLNLHPSYST